MPAQPNDGYHRQADHRDPVALGTEWGVALVAVYVAGKMVAQRALWFNL